ncbi:MAG: AAA family ATPase, partial [Campylobacterota bacterium]|nr:AAA family ATPase [Campylobacterota bacterium]
VKDNKELLYIDKTKYIEVLEDYNRNNLMFLRPRRFGKSLFISTLWHYYDERFTDEFDELFGDTYIGANPTKLKNSYRVLFLEFSGIDIDDLKNTFDDFVDKIKKSLQVYLQSYNYSEDEIKSFDNISSPEQLMNNFFKLTKDDKIYLLIDEYDHFANGLLAHSISDFAKVLSKGGFVRIFYETIKTATMTGVVHKVFITGVTPITLDSLSSGFNIIDNISTKIEFNEMVGFNFEEVDNSLKNCLFPYCDENRDKIYKDIKDWYNGYLFNTKAKTRMYNATLVNYFISNFDKESCLYPANMLDVNIASDYRTIMKLFYIGDTEQNNEILKTIIQKGEIRGFLKDRYDIEKEFGYDDFITLLYSMGFITIKRKIFDNIVFEIPNYIITHLYFNYFAKELEKKEKLKLEDKQIRDYIIELAFNNYEPFQNKLTEVINTLSNRDYAKFDEKHFHTIILTLLNFSNIYFIKSQPELNNKYPDILLIARNPYEDEVKSNYLLELKWAKKGEFESKKKEGITQVKNYLELEDVKNIPKLKSFVVIGSNDKVEFVEI